jgi:ribosomal protein L22
VAQAEDEAPAATEEQEAAAEAGDAEPVAAESPADVAPQAEEEQEAVAPAEADEAEPGAEDEEPEEPEAEAPARQERSATPSPAPAPPRRRRRGERLDVEVRAQAKYVRSSARKARLVCDHIRGKSVEEARAILAHTPRAIARDWSRLLESAVANAEHNHELIGEDLYVKAVRADEGPTIKRYRPRALGRATRIRKRTSHLTILLKPKP